MANKQIPFAETRNYVEKILSRAGRLPQGSPEEVWKALVPHVMHQESRGNKHAVSPKGAKGTMQTMPFTLRDPGFGVRPAQNDSYEEMERVGKDYLLAMVKRYPGRADMALAAYNAGPGRADAWVRQGVGGGPGAGFAPLTLRDSAGMARGPSRGIGVMGELGDTYTQTQKDGNYWTNVIGRDSSIAGMDRLWEEAGMAFDPDFRISGVSDDDWKRITYDIPEEQWEGLGGAKSMEHLELLAQRIRTANDTEAELAKYGGWGVAGRMLYGTVGDPLSFAIGVGTGGFGYLAKGERLAAAVKAARHAGQLEESAASLRALQNAANASKWARAGRAATIAGAENASLEALINAGDPTKDGWDVLMAGVSGATLGGLAGRFFSGKEQAALRHAYRRESYLNGVAELSARVEAKQGELGDLIRVRGEAHEGSLVALRKAEEAHAASLRPADEGLVDTVRAHRDTLSADAQGALKRSELGALSREVKGLRKAAKKNTTLEKEIAARMLREDIAVHGEDVARSKDSTKMRAKAAAKEAREQITKDSARLKLAEEKLAAATKAQDALTELRKVERRLQKGDREGLLEALPQKERDALLKKWEGAKAKADEARALLDDAKLKADNAKSGLDATQAELDGLHQGNHALFKAQEAATSDGFGADSHSAARFDGFDEGIHPHMDGDGTASGLPEVGKTAFASMQRLGPLATFTGIFRGSDNALVRKLFGRLVGNSAGNADGSVNTVGASEIARRVNQALTAKFYSAIEPAYKKWAADENVGRLGRLERKTRQRFGIEVGLAIRQGDHADPTIKAAAAKVSAVLKEYAQQAKDAGVKGFEDLDLSKDGWLPRVFDFNAQAKIEADIGTPNMLKLIGGAIDAANPGMKPKTLEKLSRAYLDTMKSLRVGSDAHLMQGMKWDDVGFLRKFLHDAGVPSDEVEEVVADFAALNKARGRQDEGSFRNAKRRVQLDETFSITVRSQNAAKAGRIEDVTVTFADLLENNVEALFGRYTRSMSGHIGLAKVGIKSKADFDRSIKLIERELANSEELQKVKKAADVVYKLITGTPIQDVDTLSKWGRFIRDYNFSTTMNQAGWAQVPDLAGLLQKGYLSYTIKEFFGGDFMRYFKRTDGSLDLDALREAEEWLGTGTDFHNNALFSSYDPMEEVGFEGLAGSAHHAVKVAGRGTQMVSGMAWMTSFAQRMSARVVSQRLVKVALSGEGMSARRHATLGLDQPMLDRIQKQIKAHTEFANGDFGGKVRVVNWAKWDDVEARDSMLTAIHREARRLVQEEDLGDTPDMIHRGWGKILWQFRRFALVSYSKQLLHGLNHADAEEGTRVLISSALAAFAYTLRHNVALAEKQVGGADESELEEYREKYLSPNRLAAAAIANSAYSGMLPMMWDSTVGMATGERFFDTRTSGLGSDFITGNPTYTTMKNALGTAPAGVFQAIIRGDRQFTQGDARAVKRLMPFQNVLGSTMAMQALTAGLPEKDYDPDPDTVDWLLQD